MRAISEQHKNRAGLFGQLNRDVQHAAAVVGLVIGRPLADASPVHHSVNDKPPRSRFARCHLEALSCRTMNRQTNFRLLPHPIHCVKTSIPEEAIYLISQPETALHLRQPVLSRLVRDTLAGGRQTGKNR
jgi:hypothetical protein